MNRVYEVTLKRTQYATVRVKAENASEAEDAAFDIVKEADWDDMDYEAVESEILEGDDE